MRSFIIPLLMCEGVVAYGKRFCDVGYNSYQIIISINHVLTNSFQRIWQFKPFQVIHIIKGIIAEGFNTLRNCQ